LKSGLTHNVINDSRQASRMAAIACHGVALIAKL